MNDKDLADVVCRCLLALVAAIRKRYGLPTYHGVTVVLQTEPPGVMYSMPHVESEKISA
jgi:hypothetical protein